VRRCKRSSREHTCSICLSAAACILNNLYREAGAADIVLVGVRVAATGDFDRITCKGGDLGRRDDGIHPMIVDEQRPSQNASNTASEQKRQTSLADLTCLAQRVRTENVTDERHPVGEVLRDGAKIVSIG